MPRKKKVEAVKVEPEEGQPLKTDEELTEAVKAKVFKEEPKPEEPKIESKEDTVKVKVLIGTFEFEGGVFSEGDVFEVSRERAKQFERTSVKILEK